MKHISSLPSESEAFISDIQFGAALALGVVSLVGPGVLPVLLGALGAEHRLSAAGIGLAATAESLTMVIGAGVGGLIMRPGYYRPIVLAAGLVLVLANLSAVFVTAETWLIVARGAVGLPEGLFIWVAVAAIARKGRTERWASVMMTISTSLQLGTAAGMTSVLLPRFGASGGLVLLAIVSLVSVAASLFIPNRFIALTDEAASGRFFPPRGWLALLATVLILSSSMSVFVYLVLLAETAGLSITIAGVGLSAMLGTQIAGGIVTTLIADRLKYCTVIVGCCGAYLLLYPVYALSPSALMFVAASGAIGFVNYLIIPYLYPMAVDTDPSLRTVSQSGTAQLLGATVGPFLAALTVEWRGGVEAVIPLSLALLVSGTAIVIWLKITSRRPGEQTLQSKACQ